MKKILRSKVFLEIIIILFLGLTPLLWFHDNQVILGHDAGLTLSPVSHFFDRLQLWTERFGFGADQSYAVAGFFIHGLEALVAFFTNNNQIVQKIVFIFWFTLPGLAMYYLARKFEKQFLLSYVALPASIFYMFNHFLLQGWFVAERTKFSLYIALPLIVAFLLEWQEKKRSNVITAILISLTLFIFNGEGSLPLFGSLLITIILYSVYYLASHFTKEGIISYIQLVVYFVIFSLLLQSYWLFPYIFFVLQSYAAEVVKAGGSTGVTGWIDYVSKDSSLINILRLYGIPEWYQNPLHPYASVFFNNPLLFGLSFLFPIAAFSPLLLYFKKKEFRLIHFLAVLALVSIIFIAGSHPPFGSIYIFLINTVPGFIAFRTPFYKFAASLWFAYALLISFSISYLITKIKLKNLQLAKAVYVCLCIGIVLYSFPFLTGQFFDYIVGKRTMRITVPQYVYDFGKWSEQENNRDNRMIVLPRTVGNVDTYSWGYWSLAPVTSLLTNASIVNQNGLTKNSQKLVDSLYDMMIENDPNWPKVAQFLGIHSFLLRNDFSWNEFGSITDNPQAYKKALSSSAVKRIASFGKWDVYSLVDTDTVKPHITVDEKINYLNGDPGKIGKVLSLPNISAKDTMFIEEGFSGNTDTLVAMAKKTIVFPTCIQCDLQLPYMDLGLYRPIIVQGSYVYPAVELMNKFEKVFNKKENESMKDKAYQSLTSLLGFEMIMRDKKPEVAVIASITEYQGLLGQLDKKIDEYLGQGNLTNDATLDVLNIVNTSKTIFLNAAEDLSGEDSLEIGNATYTKLTQIQQKLYRSTWVTQNDYDKRMLLAVPKDDTYTITYNPNDPTLVGKKDLEFYVDGVRFTKNGQQINSDWVDLGTINLTKGEHKLSLIQKTLDLYKGQQNVQVTANVDGGCTNIFTLTGNNTDVYHVTFQYKRDYGDVKFYLNPLKTEKIENVLDSRGDKLSSQYSGEYVRDFSIAKDGEKIYLYICNYPMTKDKQTSSAITINSISVKKLIYPNIIFSSQDTGTRPVVYTAAKQNQTNYVVDIATKSMAPKIVSFNEAFNSNWEIGEANTNLLINGYANAAIIDGNSSKVTINYKPQKVLFYGFIISFSTALLLCGFLIYKKVKKAL